MKTLLILIVGIAIGVGAVWYLGSARTQEIVGDSGDRIAAESRELSRDINEAIDGEKIKRGLEEVGDAVAAKAGDAAVTAKIKTKFAADPVVSAFKIDVDTSDEVVTLSGTVESASEVERAIEIAKSLSESRKVMSTLQVAHVSE